MSLLTRAVAIGAAGLLAGCARGPEPGALSGWNVLLLTIDTLRADRVGFSGYGAARTPAMDALAESGVVFESAISSAPVTLPSHATILTGLYPPSHGALDNGFYSLPDGVPTLGTILSGEGYATAAFVGAFVLHRRYGLDRGFDVYDDRFREQQAPGQLEVERPAGEVAAQAAAWITAAPGDRPFFVWAHFFDPHAPYEPPQPFRMELSPYDGEIAYTDRSVGELLDAVRKTGRLERTLVILLADHGEAFGDGGESTHGLLLRGATLRVPFVMSGGLPRRRVEGTVSTADLLPTVLALLGVGAPGGLEGVSLLEAVREGRAVRPPAYSETRLPEDQLGWAMLAGCRDDRWAYVRAPTPELYDLREDPGETRSLHRDRPEVVRELDALVAAALTGATVAEREALTPETEAALRALGYVAAGERPEPSGADPKTMLALLSRIESAHAGVAAGQWEAALREAEGVLETDPGNPEARILRGQALIGAGRRDEGIVELIATLEAGADRGRVGTLLAQAFREDGRLEEAAALCRALMESEPEVSQHPFHLGGILWQLGRRHEARDALEESLRRNPDAVHALANLAQVLSRTDWDGADPERAVGLLDRAVELSTDGRPRLLRIYLLADLGRREAALRAAEELARGPLPAGITPAQLEEARRYARGG